jgi:antitoxin component YwqK of YwqJK toxin-antitoxin module
MRNIWLIVFVLFIASCGTTLQEEIVESYNDGTPKRVKYFQGEENDKFLKKEIFYYENGNKRVEGEYNKEGKKDGKWAYWYKDGKKWSEGYFSEGVNDKKRTTWHESGSIHYEGTYDKGTRVGIWKFYDEDGKMVKEINYDDMPE